MNVSPKRPLPAELLNGPLDQEFWDAAARREFVLHQCQTCQRYYWPASCCVDHGLEHMKWVPASGRGKVHTFTIYYRALNPMFLAEVPYNFVVVELDEGPFMFGNVIDCDNDDLHCDMRLEMVFEEVAPGVIIPKFRPAAGQR